jgi:hypothetical protein
MPFQIQGHSRKTIMQNEKVNLTDTITRVRPLPSQSRTKRHTEKWNLEIQSVYKALASEQIFGVIDRDVSARDYNIGLNDFFMV